MKKLALLFFILFFSHLYARPSHAAGSWVDQDLIKYAAALDKARGINYEHDPDCFTIPEKLKANLSPQAETQIKTYVDKQRSDAIELQTKDSDEEKAETVNMEGYATVSLDTSAFGFGSAILGRGKTNCTNPTIVMEHFNRSAMGTTSKLIAGMVTDRPASFAYYAYDLLHNAGFVEKTYAQGIGYSGLFPILDIWKVFRNLTYIILVIVMIVIGFMIMFRMKLDAQTVISIQNALPNIVLTLILITFSYAIAGLLIDLMYFLMSLIVNVFYQSGIEKINLSVTQTQERFTNANFGTLFSSISLESIGALPSAILTAPLSGVWDWAASGDGIQLNDLATGFLMSIPAVAVGLVGGVVGFVLVAIALLFTIVRIFFILLNSYIQIILSIIFAPLYLIVGAIPGRNAFRNWLMSLVGNLIVFPTLAGIFLLIDTLALRTISETVGDPTGSPLWVAPFLVGANAEPSLVLGLISFGLLILTPSLLNTVKGALAPKPFLPITPGVIFQPVLGAGQTFMSVTQQRYYGRQAFNINDKSSPLLKAIFGGGGK